MSNEQLAEAYQATGDNKHLAAIYSGNRGLIEMFCAKYAGLAEPDDLRQEAFFAVLASARTWNPEKGAAFSSWLCHWLRNVMIRYLQKSGVIRLPFYLQAEICRYRQTVQALTVSLERDPRLDEIAGVMQITVKKAQQLQQDALLFSLRSLNESLGDESEATLEDVLPDAQNEIEGLIDSINGAELAAELRNIIAELPAAESEIITARYYKEQTRKQCAETMGLPIHTVQKLERAGLRRLGRSRNRRRLLPYIDGCISLTEIDLAAAYRPGNSWLSTPEKIILQRETRDEAQEQGEQ